MAPKPQHTFIKNFSGDRKEATMLLYAPIGVDNEGNGISGERFANEIYSMQDMGVENIKVRINSPGGNVMDGFSIFSAITNAKCNVETFIDGMAASIAGIIAMAGKRVHMADIGMLMIHDPSMDGDEPSTAKDKEILGLIKNSLVTTLTNKTGFDPIKMGDMMAAETWMDCSTAKEHGFIDEIFTTNLPKENIAVITNKSAAKLFLSFQNLLQPINKKSMKKVATLLNLADESNEDSIVSEIEKLKAENLALKTENEAHKAEKEKIAELEIAEVINGAIKANKIKDTEKASWEVLAKTDLSAVKNAFESMGKSKVATKVTDAIRDVSKKAIVNGTDRTTWNFRKFEKEAPEELETMKNEAPEQYKMLLDAHMAIINEIRNR